MVVVLFVFTLLTDLLGPFESTLLNSPNPWKCLQKYPRQHLGGVLRCGDVPERVPL